MKVCFKCKENKELKEFYKHKMMGDGHLNKCKVCTKKDVRARESKLVNDPEWKEKEKSRHREKYYRLGYKEKHKPTPENKKKSIENYKNKYPEKYKAKSMSGKLKPIIKGNHLHHWSYNEDHFKDVIEVTEKDHNLLHRYMKYDQGFKMYRKTKDNSLLDSKESHINLLEIIKQQNIPF